MLYLAPLHGLTDVTFRNVYFRHFGGFDRAMAPFISITPADKITSVKVRDLSPRFNDIQKIVPQLLVNEAEGFLLLSRFLSEQYGYQEINWNLGCPVLNIVKKQRGSGLLPFPEKIDRFLNKVMSNTTCDISVKTRLGYWNSSEFIPLAKVLNQYPLKSVTVHPRIGVQMYEGELLHDDFRELLPLLDKPVIYNGDFWKPDDYKKVKQLYPSIQDHMIGRGALFNPFLPGMIVAGSDQLPDNSMELFVAWYYDLEQQIRLTRRLWMDKMKEYWKFFYRFFELDREQLLSLQKITNENEWNERICKIFSL